MTWEVIITNPTGDSGLELESRGFGLIDLCYDELSDEFWNTVFEEHLVLGGEERSNWFKEQITEG